MDRNDNIEIFEDTMRLCRENSHLADFVRSSTKRQKVILESYGLDIPSPSSDVPCTIMVTKRRTMEAATRYQGKTAVLNFASWTNPGGGVKTGANAQEESICRISTLYPCLADREMMNRFYLPHREEKSYLHNDDCIYTPRVIVFKTDAMIPRLLPEDSWSRIDVITCAAPNLRLENGEKRWIGDKDLLELHCRRIGRILDIAGVENMVLGAFGCGVFLNDPEIVALASLKALENRRCLFKKIEFAVYSGKGTANYNAFKKILS